MAGKATATEIFDLTTTREWLKTNNSAAGQYAMVTSTGTAQVYVYNASNTLIHMFDITSTSSNNVISSTFARMEAIGSTSLDLSITPVNAKITANGGTLTLNRITGSGNFGSGSGNAAGGTSGYVAGQSAHVIVVGGGGGGGGGGNNGGSANGTGGSGGAGGISYTNTPISLTGTYALTVGAGGNAGSSNSSWNGNVGYAGSAGSASTGFSFTSNAGGGGNGTGAGPAQGTPGANGTPAVAPQDTQIFKPTSYALLEGGTPGAGAPGNSQPFAGGAGRVLVLRWTP
jgi:hypothetical protein